MARLKSFDKSRATGSFNNRPGNIAAQRVVKRTPLVKGQKYLPATSSVVTGLTKR